MDQIPLDETLEIDESFFSGIQVTETITLTLVLISVIINVFLIYILRTGKSKNPDDNNSTYYVITHMSYFLIMLLATYLGFIIISHVSNRKMFAILYDAHNHLLLALYSLMIMFGFNYFLEGEQFCKQFIKILWTVTITMILYSVSLAMCDDALSYSFVALRVIAFVALVVILIVRIALFLYRSCTRVELEMLQSVLILSFLCCWFPDFLFNVFHVDILDLSVIYCIGVVACASNLLFNIILILIVDEKFRIPFNKFTIISRYIYDSECSRNKVTINNV